VKYDSLNIKEIIKTIAALQARIEKQFPRSGLSKVCEELLLISKDAEEELILMQQPRRAIRIAIGVVILLLLAFSTAVIITFFNIVLEFKHIPLSEFLQGLDANINIIVLLGVALFFLIRFERSLKRKRILSYLNKLHSFAHVVDLHQLKKDPKVVLEGFAPDNIVKMRKMTPYELCKYLDCCIEMLSLIGKVAALYAKNNDDSLVIQSVHEIEILTTGFSRKIGQKILVIHSGKQ
jgi:hypothetical protein